MTSATESLRLDWRLAVRDDERLPAGAKHLALTLAIYMDDEGVCWPAIETLAAAMSVADRTVQRHLRDDADLVRLGYLRVLPGGGKGNTHRFEACLPAVDTPTQSHPLGARNGDTVSSKGDTVSRNGDTVSPELVFNSSTNSSENDDEVSSSVDDLLHGFAARSASQRAAFAEAYRASPDGFATCVAKALTAGNPVGYLTTLVRARAHLAPAAPEKRTPAAPENRTPAERLDRFLRTGAQQFDEPTLRLQLGDPRYGLDGDDEIDEAVEKWREYGAAAEPDRGDEITRNLLEDSRQRESETPE